jgi:hypothetical protein
MNVRDFQDILNAFNPAMVEWLAVLLALEFVTGVVLALKTNSFDWSRVFDIAKKNVWIAVGWGTAFVYSDQLSAAVYALAVAWLSGGILNNLAALTGFDVSGFLGQLVNKGPGDGSAAGTPAG